MKAFLLSGIVLLCLFISCRKTDDVYYPITDQRLRDAVNIHPGSYFVYADSATGVEDSFFVYSFNHNTDAGTWEYMRFAMRDKDGNNMTIQAGGGNADSKDKIGVELTIGGQHYPDFYFLQLPYADQGSPLGNPYQFHPSYDVSGKSYSDVYEQETQFRINFGDTSGAFQGSVRTCYSLHDGLIKFEATDTTQFIVYQLKRSFIVRE